MYSVGDAVVSILALSTLAYLLHLAKVPFKKHQMNIFSHLMLVLLFFSLVSKCLGVTALTFVETVQCEACFS